MKSFRKAIIAITFSFSMAIAAGKLSEKCLDELSELPSKNENFNMADFTKELPVAVVKVKAQEKTGGLPIVGSFLGPGPDTKITEVGITVGCAKAFPENLEDVKATLKDIIPYMLKAIASDKLGVSKDEVPTNLNQFRDFAQSLAVKKTAELLETNAKDIPATTKELEDFISNEINKQAVKSLGVSKSDIPKNKSQLSAFVKNAAKEKVAEELGMEIDEVQLNAKALKEITLEDEALNPVTNLVRIANILDVLALAKGSGGDEDDDEDEEDGEEEEKPRKPTKEKPKKDKEDKSYTITLIAGANNSKIEGSLPTIPIDADYSINVNYKMGFQGGVMFNTGYFKTGLILIQKGATLEEILNYDLGNFYCYQEVSLYFIEVPLLFSYAMPMGDDWSIRADAGVYLSRGLKQQREYTLDLSGIFESARDQAEALLQDTNLEGGDYGLSFGFGVELSSFYIGLFYDYGIAKNANEETLRTIGLNLGYSF